MLWHKDHSWRSVAATGKKPDGAEVFWLWQLLSTLQLDLSYHEREVLLLDSKFLTLTCQCQSSMQCRNDPVPFTWLPFLICKRMARILVPSAPEKCHRPCFVLSPLLYLMPLLLSQTARVPESSHHLCKQANTMAHQKEERKKKGTHRHLLWVYFDKCHLVAISCDLLSSVAANRREPTGKTNPGAREQSVASSAGLGGCQSEGGLGSF